MEIYYFSGTGNSFHVARELQRHFSDASLTPFAGLEREETIISETDGVC